MERLLLIGFAALAFNIVSSGAAIAAEPVRSESILAEQAITTFDPLERVDVASVEKSGAKPPSGDSNPSDRFNSTVDSRDIIDPQAK